jgi:hypothetical protein
VFHSWRPVSCLTVRADHPNKEHAVLFHVQTPPAKGFSPAKKGPDAPQNKWWFSPVRGLAGIFFLIVIVVAAFFAHQSDWKEGSDMLLRFAEIVFGGIVGLIFGERLALNDVNQ